VHPQWRIDIRDSNDFNTHMLADPDEQMKYLLDDFYKEYLKWSLKKRN
jgi:hypothetical protein